MLSFYSLNAKSFSSNKSGYSYNVDFEEVQLKEIAIKIKFILTLIGIAGNILHIYAFLQKKSRCLKINCYLMYLAISQFIFCFTLFFDYLFCFMRQQKFLHDYNIYANVLIDFIIHACDWNLTAITLFLSIDRLYAIKNPIKLKRFFTQKHIKAIMIGSILISIVGRIPFLISCVREVNTLVLICSTVPFLINICFLVVNFILAVALVKEMAIYYRSISKEATASLLVVLNNNSLKSHKTSEYDGPKMANSSVFNAKQMTSSQKLHYTAIIISSLWSVVASITYYTLLNYWTYFNNDLFSKHFNLKTTIIMQIISSIFNTPN